MRIHLSTALLIAILFLLVSPGADAAVVEYLGFRLAQPTEIPNFERRRAVVMYQYLRDIRLNLSIDQKGRVTEVAPESEADSTYSLYLDEYLKSWRWSPAEFEGQKVNSRIMISAFFTAGYSRPKITYPGDSLTCDAITDLRFESFSLNGIEPPRLIEFPSLSLLVNKKDTSNFCAFTVLNLELDTTGRVLSSLPINDNEPKYLPKLSSALLWSKIEPARINGQAVNSNVYIALTFNRNLNYPTIAWKSCCLDELNLLQRESLRLMLDTVRYIIPPIPQLPPGDSINLARSYRLSSQKIFCRVDIKKSGKAIWHAQNRIRPQDNRVRQSLGKNVRFFPAIGSDGNPVQFSGYAIIHRLNSRTIRIEYSWLNEGRLSSPATKVK